MKGPYSALPLDRMSTKYHLRFLSNLTLGHPGGCWGWSGCTTGGPAKMAQLRINGVNYLAHRLAYEHYVDHIPPRMVLDHLCKNPWCVNPHHQEPVTQRENNLRSSNMASRNHRKTECLNGHPFDRITSEGSRVCSVCRKNNMLRFLERHGRDYRRKTK